MIEKPLLILIRVLREWLRVEPVVLFAVHSSPLSTIYSLPPSFPSLEGASIGVYLRYVPTMNIIYALKNLARLISVDQIKIVALVPDQILPRRIDEEVEELASLDELAEKVFCPRCRNLLVRDSEPPDLVRQKIRSISVERVAILIDGQPCLSELGTCFERVRRLVEAIRGG